MLLQPHRFHSSHLIACALMLHLLQVPGEN